MPRLSRLVFAITLIFAFAAAPAKAHHGLSLWDEENPITLEGFVSETMDGFPHWEIRIRVEGVDWIVHLGNEFYMEAAGMKGDGSDLNIGDRIKIEAWRSLTAGEREVRPLKIYTDDAVYDFSKHRWY